MRVKRAAGEEAAVGFDRRNPDSVTMMDTNFDKATAAAEFIRRRTELRPRIGIVLEVLGEPDHVHYRVRWDEDGHESIFTPSNDVTFRHAADQP